MFLLSFVSLTAACAILRAAMVELYSFRMNKLACALAATVLGAVGSGSVHTKWKDSVRKIRSVAGNANAAMLLLVVIPACVYIRSLWRFKHWLIDDALISMAYARTLTETGKFAQSPFDAPVEGVSNPLWTLGLAFLRLIRVFDSGHTYFGVADYVFVFRVLAVVAFVVVQVLLIRAAKAISPSWGRVAGTLGALLLAMSAPYVIWSASGLENPLYAVLLAALVCVVVRSVATSRLHSYKTACVCGVLAFLISATRPDGVTFFGFFPLILAAGTRRPVLKQAVKALCAYVAIGGVSIGAMFLVRRVLFGLWVPNTAVAKAQVLKLETMTNTAETITNVLTWAWMLPLCALSALLWLSIKEQRLAIATGIWAIVLAAFVFCGLVPDWLDEYRFATPLVVAMAAMTTIVFAVLAQHCAPCGVRRSSLVSPASVAAVLSISVVLSLIQTEMGGRIKRFSSRPPVPGCKVANVFGRTFNAYADIFGVTDGTVAMQDIGGSLLTSRLKIVDLAGLTDPTLAKLRGENKLGAIRNYVLDEVKPTFMHFHGAFRAGIPEDPRFRNNYVLIDDNDNYVRKDVISAHHDLDRIKKEGSKRNRALYSRFEANAALGCGTLARGQLPD